MAIEIGLELLQITVVFLSQLRAGVGFGVFQNGDQHLLLGFQFDDSCLDMMQALFEFAAGATVSLSMLGLLSALLFLLAPRVGFDLSGLICSCRGEPEPGRLHRWFRRSTTARAPPVPGSIFPRSGRITEVTAHGALFDPDHVIHGLAEEVHVMADGDECACIAGKRLDRAWTDWISRSGSSARRASRGSAGSAGF